MNKFMLGVLLVAAGTINSFGMYTVNVNSFGAPATQYLNQTVGDPLKKIQLAIGDKTDDSLAQNTQRLRDVQENLLMVALQMSQIQTLTDTGVILKEAPGANGEIFTEDGTSFNAISMPTDGLSFDGKTIIGEDFKYAGNIVGLSGAPIGLDKALPTVITPVTNSEQSVLTQMSSQFLSSASPAVITNLIRGSAINGDMNSMLALTQILNLGVSGLSQGSTNTSQLLGNTLPLAAGVVMRQITTYDSEYNQALKGTGVDLTGFYLEAMKEGQFNSTLGFTNLPGAAPDMANIVTSGAKQAMDSYYLGQGSGNTSALVAMVAASSVPILRQLASTTPGSALAVDPNSLFSFRSRNFNGWGKIQLCSATTDSVGIVSGANPTTAIEFAGKMDENAQRVSENVAQEKFDQKVLEWNQKMIKHLQTARDEVSEIRKNLKAGKSEKGANADTAITQLLVQLDNMILARQDRAHEIMGQMEGLKESRRLILQDRENIRKFYLAKAQEEASAGATQIKEALRQSSDTSMDSSLTF
jgi:hypothetical protein